jgi:UDP-glucose 4-epimerase
MKQTILVTGGAGYIGSHTAFLLAQQGYNVIILDTLVHDQIFTHTWATFIKGNCGDRALLEKIFTQYSINTVMHFAAYIEVGESVTNPLKYYQNNVTNTLNLLESMLAHNIRNFIFSSSCAVYGIPETNFIAEDHPKNPISPYGITKYIIEKVLEDLHTAHKLEYVSLRYFNAVGALPEYGLYEQHKPETHLIPLLLQAAITQKPFYIFGTDHPTPDGSCIRDFLHVWDIAHAHAKAVTHLKTGKPSDCFNLGTGYGLSVKQMIAHVEQITKTKLNTLPVKNRAGDPPILVANASKAHDILGWRPHYSDITFIIQSAYIASMHIRQQTEEKSHII